jgi:hypothetical protein
MARPILRGVTASVRRSIASNLTALVDWVEPQSSQRGALAVLPLTLHVLPELMHIATDEQEDNGASCVPSFTPTVPLAYGHRR